jgi:hypothetical protein
MARLVIKDNILIIDGCVTGNGDALDTELIIIKEVKQ